LKLGSLFKIPHARGSDPYMISFFKVPPARGSCSFMGSFSKFFSRVVVIRTCHFFQSAPRAW